jgi:acyl-CoA reductase-like NAD-dependent aldehyde dehydrogenase
MTRIVSVTNEKELSTDRARLDQTVTELTNRKDYWAQLPLPLKIEYARSVLEGLGRTASGQVQAALEAKGIAADSPLAGEDWLGGPYVTTRNLRLLIATLDGLRHSGRVEIERSRIRQLPDGQVAVEVFPLSLYDRLLYSGFRAEVRMDREVTLENLDQHIGGIYRVPPRVGSVALVLGAGNVASIAPLDVAHKLFVEGRVVVLKLNPVNDYLGPFLEDAFGELIRDGYVHVVYGGADVGQYLCYHPQVDEIHITGSAATHDAIVFGSGTEGQRRKAKGEPLLKKPITSELGNVSPVVLVPGRWSGSDIRFHAENVATQIAQNGGFNCNAAKVLVTHASWPQRDVFLDELRRVLRGLTPRPAYYPGAEERYARFVEAYPQAEVLGRQRPGVLPPTLIPGLDPGESDSLAFTTESFCAVSAETALSGANEEDFLQSAIDFCNKRLHGTLNCSLIVHPKTEERLGVTLETAISDLSYGTVAINHWPAMGFALGSTPWGAFPGHRLDDIQSGRGSVHNTFLFEKPEKTVIDGPFRVFPKPAWFVTHRNAHRVGEHLTALEADPGPGRLPAIVVNALRS